MHFIKVRNQTEVFYKTNTKYIFLKYSLMIILHYHSFDLDNVWGNL